MSTASDGGSVGSGVKALILAAGLGTRLRPLTDTTPKCLVPIGDRPLLGYWVEALARCGVTDAVLNTHHLREKVDDYIAEVSAAGRVHLSAFHEPKLLGSAGTVAHNPNLVGPGERCLVIYADNLSDLDLPKLLAFDETHDDPVTIMLFHTTRPKECGIAELDADGRIVRFEEKPQNPRGDLANGGVYVLSADAYREIVEMNAFDIGFDVLPKFAGRMRAYIHDGYHRDIGNLDALEQARADVGRVFAKWAGA